MANIKYLFFFLLWSQQFWAQPAFEKFALDSKLGIGASFNSDFYYVAGGEVNASRKKMIYTAEYLYFKEVSFYLPQNPEERFNRLGFYAGTYFGEKHLRLQLQSGVCAFWGTSRYNNSFNQYELHEFFGTIGIPAKVGLKIIPFYFLALGIGLQANLNFSGLSSRQCLALKLEN